MAGQSVRDIRRRITSVKNTQQITKAMEMVSAAKLRRSQHQVTAGRPFAAKLRDVLARLTQAHKGAEGDESAKVPDHPLLEVRTVKKVLYVVITADRGLAGGYNANLIRYFAGIQKDEQRDMSVIAIGRKGRDHLVKTGVEPIHEYLYIGDEVDYHLARQLAGQLMDYFTSGAYDEINLVYSEFVSAVTQRPSVLRLLPLDQAMAAAEEWSAEQQLDYIYEPNPEAVLGILLPRYVETEVYRILLESKASEHGARMTAMRAASDNAEEMIDMLTLTYNRARQAGITKEISEIVGGAEAIAAD